MLESIVENFIIETDTVYLNIDDIIAGQSSVAIDHIAGLQFRPRNFQHSHIVDLAIIERGVKGEAAIGRDGQIIAAVVLQHHLVAAGQTIDVAADRYYGVPGNRRSLDAFRSELCRQWRKALRRRGNKRPINWSTMTRLIRRWVPSVRIVHPYPNQRWSV